MNKTAAVRAVIEATADEPIVFTTGYTCRIAQGVLDRPNHFYMTGSMGLASSIGIGIAQQTGRPTVVVDGDGSLLMNPAGLVAAGALGSLPLVHVLLDDGKYASTGGQHVPSGGTDFALLARGSGYPRVERIERADVLVATLRALAGTCAAPTLLHCALAGDEPPVPPRVDGDLAAHAARFATALRKSAPC
ncbi:thiamine pyrophosphate-dependent enzyme [Streptomyces rubiginosohelvolus]|uniref:thiamine pyrophosphate-dependent enzyme n=1 Tax=Streptomyces rubiginosohelvolus TaxID=67362 RepID=UPI00369D0E48